MCAPLVPLALVLLLPGPAVQSSGMPQEGAQAASGTLELSLEQALELALRNNISLRIAEVDTERASYDHLASWGAFEWDFTATGRYTDAEREVTSSFISGGSNINSESEYLELDFRRPLQTGGIFSVNFNADRQTTDSTIVDAETLTDDALVVSLLQPLLRGAWEDFATSAQRQRELDWRTTVEAQRAARQDVIGRVHNAYWDLVAAIQLRDVALSGMDLGSELLEKRERELAAGVGTQVVVLESQAEVSRRIEALQQARNTAEQAMDDLKFLLYSDPEPALLHLAIEPTTPLPSIEEAPALPDEADARTIAFQMRPDLRQQRLAIDVADLIHQRTQSERLAGLDLTLTASSGNVDANWSQAWQDTLSWDVPTYVVGLTYNMPIGNKTARYAERSAEAAVRAARLQYDQFENNAVAAVRRGLREVEYRIEAVKTARTSLLLAERQLEAERARNEQGLSTNYQVLEIQQDYVEALSNERSAEVEYAKSLVVLLQAQGLLGERGLGQ